ncbi:MAG TPA: alanine racemase, partial [Atribacterota bacterium]|nr:alanine racemase [Atribacterota bacterium]
MKELLGSAWLEINLDAVKSNIVNIRNLIGKQIKIMGIVKGNGYGHDAIEVARIILENGADELAVARIEEALFLRKNNISAPILVLGVAFKEQAKLYLDYNIKPSLSDLDTISSFNNFASQLNKKMKIHLKIDTGMGRLGMKLAELKQTISDFEKMQNIEIEGVYTHFSTSDEGDKKYTYYQFDLFKEAIDLFKNSNIP